MGAVVGHRHGVGVSADVGMAVRMAGYRSVIKVAALVVAYG